MNQNNNSISETKKAIYKASTTFKIKDKVQLEKRFPTKFNSVEFDLENFRSFIQEGFSWASGHYKTGRRKNDHFIKTTFGAVDFDGGLSIEEALSNSLIADNASLIYTSISHKAESNRYRVIFCFERELNAFEYSLFLKHMYRKFPMMDPNSKTISQLYAGNSKAEFPLCIDRTFSNSWLNQILAEEQEALRKEEKERQEKAAQKLKFHFEEDYRLAEKCLHALSFIPDKRQGDGTRNDYISITGALLQVFRPEEVANILLSKVDPNSSFKPWKAVEKIEWGKVEYLFAIAKRHGWSQHEFYSQNHRETFKISPTTLVSNSQANLNICEQYLSNSEELKNNLFRYNVIQSLQGTGKTKFISDFIKDKKYIIITNRIKLCEEFHAKLEEEDHSVGFYNDIRNLKRYSDNLIICINSLYKIDPNNFRNYIIVIDEVDQVIQQLFSDICKFSRGQIFNNLSNLLRNSQQAFFLSADIPRSTISFLNNTLSLSNVNHVYNRYIPYKGRKAIIHQDIESILEHIENTLSNNVKCSISCFTKEFANFLYNHLKEKYPNKKSILFTQDTKEFAENALILRNREELMSNDIFIYTSVLSTGIDFNFKFSNVNYLISDTAKSLNHFEGFQMASRFRQFEELHVYCLPSKRNDNIDLGTIYNIDHRKSIFSKFRIFRNKSEMAFNFNSYSADKIARMVKTWGRFVFNAFISKMENEKWCSNLKFNLITILENRGYSIDYKSMDIERKKLEKHKLSSERMVFKNEEKKKILEANIFHEDGYLKCFSGNPTNWEEFYEYIKIEYLTILGLNGKEPECIKILKYFLDREINLKTLKQNILNCRLLYLDKGYTYFSDAIANRSDILIDHESNTIKRFWMVHLIRRRPNKIYNSKTNILNFHNYCIENIKSINDNVFKITEHDIKHPVKLIRKFLDLFGVRQMEWDRKGKKRIERYRINYHDVRMFREVCRRRFGDLPELEKQVTQYLYTGELPPSNTTVR
ncbi:hypothetical protein LEP1GSC052_0072 [Leptospira phage vb_LkmZ_Bejolso9-LE1]|nr:hypothetical protein LEP1GSC052_0072 [Leptospira phage vb_LkmZ_Bejolso9-LE1]